MDLVELKSVHTNIASPTLQKDVSNGPGGVENLIILYSSAGMNIFMFLMDLVELKRLMVKNYERR